MTRNQYEQHKQRLEEQLRALVPRLSGTFTRRDVCEAPGLEPDRGSLYRILQDLVREGSLRVESVGAGQTPTIYRKTDVPDAPFPG